MAASRPLECIGQLSSTAPAVGALGPPGGSSHIEHLTAKGQLID